MPPFLLGWLTRLAFLLAHWLYGPWQRSSARHRKPRHTRSGTAQPPTHSRGGRKPDWVREELIRDAACCRDASCRMLASIFNRRHAGLDGTTVGKTFVSTLLRDHQHAIRLERRLLDQRRPGPGLKNATWAMDGTGKTDETGQLHFLLGIVDHGTRRCLGLQALLDKSSTTILRSLLDAIEHYGKPRTIRTDNEPIFTSRLFRFGLRLLGIRHRTIERHCPWQNGRIERFFGTLKAKLDGWNAKDRHHLNIALAQFVHWYNCIRPHQHLFGRTPAEVWNGVDIYRHRIKRCLFYEAWRGDCKASNPFAEVESSLNPLSA